MVVRVVLLIAHLVSYPFVVEDGNLDVLVVGDTAVVDATVADMVDDKMDQYWCNGPLTPADCSLDSQVGILDLTCHPLDSLIVH